MKRSNWFFCPYCTHRLFRFCNKASGIIEIKCPSCKRIFEIDLEKGGAKHEGI